MLIIVINSSKKRAFRKTKRLIALVFQPVSNRIALADVPKRIFIEFIKNLKRNTTKGTSVQIFYEAKNLGFKGFKCIQVGKEKPNLDEFTESSSLIDQELIMNGILKKT